MLLLCRHWMELCRLRVAQNPFQPQTPKIACTACCLERPVGCAFDSLRHDRLTNQSAVCVFNSGFDVTMPVSS